MQSHTESNQNPLPRASDIEAPPIPQEQKQLAHNANPYSATNSPVFFHRESTQVALIARDGINQRLSFLTLAAGTFLFITGLFGRASSHISSEALDLCLATGAAAILSSFVMRSFSENDRKEAKRNFSN